MSLENLQKKIGYRFGQPELLQQALTHRSFGSPHNERLEFLGDSVLNCAVADILYQRFSNLKEGDLTRLRATVVRRESLHRVAQSLALGAQLRLGEGEKKSGVSSRSSILADAVEALLGAIFLDGGFAAAKGAVERLYKPLIDELDAGSPGKDAKTMLQELMQSRHMPLPVYAVISTTGAAHDQRFEVECVVEKPALRASGTGPSRRAAEQAAAERVFEQMRKESSR